MVTQWYCKILGDERGPVTIEELHAMVASGKLAADDWIRPDVESVWRRADSLPGLFGWQASSVDQASSDERVATSDMAPVGGEWCSLELQSTDTKASLKWSTSSTPTVMNAANATKRALVVKVPRRTLKVGQGATHVGSEEKCAQQTTVAASFNAETATVVISGPDATIEPADAELPEHRV